jgi:hypothetical protein
VRHADVGVEPIPEWAAIVTDQFGAGVALREQTCVARTEGIRALLVTQIGGNELIKKASLWCVLTVTRKRGAQHDVSEQDEPPPLVYISKHKTDTMQAGKKARRT